MVVELDRFYIDDVDVLLVEEGNDVKLLVEGKDVPDNSFPVWTSRKRLESAARELVKIERAKGL